MILKNLRATNILKYARLDLINIPAKGQISISGPNESGKTTIVESICFALFGRTFSQQTENLIKIIRWGESAATVELEFEANDSKSYVVKRSINSDGLHSVELYRNNESKPFATGPQTVHDTIVELCRFDYPQYLDALYLAQMEISAPHSQSETIKEIAGTSELESVSRELTQESEQHTLAIENLQYEISEIEQEIKALGIGQEISARLEQEKSSLQGIIANNRNTVEKMETASSKIQVAGNNLLRTARHLASTSADTSLRDWALHGDEFAKRAAAIKTACGDIDTDNRLANGGELGQFADDFQNRLSGFSAVREKSADYREYLGTMLGENTTLALNEDPLPEQQSALKRHLFGSRTRLGFARLFFYLTGIVAILSWAGWWLLKSPVDTGYSGMASAWLEQHVTWWDASYIPWLLPIAIGLSILAVLAVIIPVRFSSQVLHLRNELDTLNERITKTRTQADTLDTFEDQSIPAATAALSGLGYDALQYLTMEYANGPGAVFANAEALSNYQKQLDNGVQQAESDIGTLREEVATRVGELNQSTRDSDVGLKKCDDKLVEIERLRQEAKQLGETIKNKQVEIDEHQNQIHLRETAYKLTQGTCRNIYKRFNGVLTEFTGQVMPKLTEGRYSQIQIDDHLKVRAFSNEKNDFGELDEFSSGSQRQMLLAVRLAMAKALVEATEQQRQFIILDEPFAFFDRKRIQSTLQALPEIDEQMSQIWIITQEFEDYKPFKLSIVCSRDSDELIVGKDGAVDRIRDKSG